MRSQQGRTLSGLSVWGMSLAIWLGSDLRAITVQSHREVASRHFPKRWLTSAGGVGPPTGSGLGHEDPTSDLNWYRGGRAPTEALFGLRSGRWVGTSRR